ncbi:MAG: amidohydrolase [Halioglobus sp.]
MKRRAPRFTALLIGRLVAGVAIGLAATSVTAATLVHNVSGYTMDGPELVTFSALEFDDGKVTRLYSAESDAQQSTATQRIDGKGMTLLPGLIDAHGHVSSHGRALASVDLVGVDSESAAVARVLDFISAESIKNTWVQGRGWNQVLWPSKEFPSRQSLDAVSGDAAVVLGRVDGHAVWVNTRALALAGITDDTPDPAGGQIIRDEQGKATGVLIDNAMTMVFSVMPVDSDEQIADYQARALHDLAANGLTSVHDAGITAQEVRGFRSLLKAHEMAVRVYAMLDVLDPANDADLEAGPSQDDAQLLVVRSVKISADGALGSRGAALFEDYSDKPGHRGLLLLTDEELKHHMGRAVAAGYQVNTHAIGDLANDRVLVNYEMLNKEGASRALRHRVEHAQILRPQDVSRFAAAGIVASIQPTHATSDKNMAGDRLGEERLKAAYAWSTLLDSGAQLAGGSDFPVESVNPFYGLHAAVTRQSHDNEPEGGWFPGQKLSREASLSLFTQDAAFAAHQEKEIGRLLPGYYADFILVSDNYFDQPENAIWKNRVEATYVAGSRVYSAEQD